jgi:hypothetical protein
MEHTRGLDRKPKLPRYRDSSIRIHVASTWRVSFDGHTEFTERLGVKPRPRA